VSVNTSRLFGEGGGELLSCLIAGSERHRSADGFGGGGMRRVKESAES
jgi:hypothetical protein